MDTWSFLNTSGKSTIKRGVPLLSFVVSLGPVLPAGMQVFGASCTFQYGSIVGSTACFPSACAHSSLTPPTSDTTFKFAFFVAFAGHPTTQPHSDAQRRYKQRGEGLSGPRLSTEVPGPSESSNREAPTAMATEAGAATNAGPSERSGAVPVSRRSNKRSRGVAHEPALGVCRRVTRSDDCMIVEAPLKQAEQPPAPTSPGLPPPTPTVPRPPSPSPTVIPPPEGGYTHAAVDRFDWPSSPTRAPAPLTVPPSVAKKSAIAKRMAPAGASSSTGAAMQSAMAELCVSDMTPEEARRITKSEAAKMLLQRAGVRHQVAPNGTCWLYAALAALRVLEHASTTSPLPEPTLRDIRSSEVVLKAMKKHFLTVPVPRKPGRAQKNASNYDDYWRVSDVLSRQNVWVRSMGDNPAEYGSEPMLTLLARTLDRTIIVLDGPTMANVRDSVSAEETGLTGEDKKHHIHEPQSQKLYRKTLNTIGVLIHLESDQDTLVLEHVNGDHYVGLALTGVAPAKLPACLSAANAALACENR